MVAQVSEEWVTPVDTQMEALGGVVFREIGDGLFSGLFVTVCLLKTRRRLHDPDFDSLASALARMRRNRGFC